MQDNFTGGLLSKRLSMKPILFAELWIVSEQIKGRLTKDYLSVFSHIHTSSGPSLLTVLWLACDNFDILEEGKNVHK